MSFVRDHSSQLGMIARTLRHASPVQILARGPLRIVQRVLWDVPGTAPPEIVTDWVAPPNGFRAHAKAERARGLNRIARLPPGSRLRAYEETYGLEIGDGTDGAANDLWRSRTAVYPYPASVRARRIAAAIRLGGQGFAEELARAARAILLQPELHLLGNHLLENGLGLSCAAAVARGAEADIWWAAGNSLLAWQLPVQFLADGCHLERSASYHVALTAALLELIELARASGRDVPDLWRTTAARALAWARSIRAPDGTYPLFNDAALDAAPTLDDLCALGVAVGIAGQVDGPADHSAPTTVTRLEPTGWLRLDTRDGTSLIVDAAPDAEGAQPGHAHADGLTFELWVRGQRAVVDFGVASYEPGTDRETTRATRSHNTVELDGSNSCEVWSAFRVGRRGKASVQSAHRHEGGWRVELEHDGYAWRPGRPCHRRILDFGPSGLEIRDLVLGGRGEPFVSRIRVDAEAARSLRVVSEPQPAQRVDGVWYARHGEPRPAVIYAAQGRAGDIDGVCFRIQW